MRCLIHKKILIPFLLITLTILVSCIPAATTGPKPLPTIVSPTISETAPPAQMMTPSATFCPLATPELFWVEPVISPTDQLTQVIGVVVGNRESVTIITESGTFTVTDSTPLEISLLPNSVHHLEVLAKVRTVVAGNGCTYGGYTLQTTRDRLGYPLTIVQGEPMPRLAKSVIMVDNASRLEELISFAPNVRAVTDFVFSTDHELISVGYDSNISMWNTKTGEEVRQLGSTQEGALVVALNSDGSFIATGGTADNPVIRLWNTQTGEMNEIGRAPTYPTSLAFNPSGTQLASGGNQDLVMIWDVNNPQLLTTFKGDVPLRLQLFSDLFWKDDFTLVAGGSQAIYWWETATGSLLQRLAKPAEANSFVDVAFSQAGDLIAAAAQDAYVHVWDQAVKQWSRWPALSDSIITRVNFSPDGQLLVGGTNKGQILIWNVKTQQLVAHYSTISSSLITVQFSPGGLYIASGGWDSPIRLWGVP